MSLDAIADAGLYGIGFDDRLGDMRFEAIRPHVRGAVLEMGPATGRMGRLLRPLADMLDCVDGSRVYCGRLQAGGQYDAVHCSFFESFAPSVVYDTIIASCVLEHVDDPVAVLRRVRGWIRPGGRLCVCVPNALSLHRLYGVQLGMLAEPAALNENDRRGGHQRVYTLPRLLADVRAGGFSIIEADGLFLKLHTNADMERYTDEMIDALRMAAHAVPDYAAHLLVVGEPECESW